MEWIKNVVYFLVFLALYWIGFSCGYLKDKKDVNCMLREAKEFYDKAQKHLDDAKKSLNKAEDDLEEAYLIRCEAQAHLECSKKTLADAHRILDDGMTLPKGENND